MVVVVGCDHVCGPNKEDAKMVKSIGMGMLCAAVLAAGVGTVLGQEDGAYPTRIKLTCITTNAGVIVKTKITEKDIIARCASDHAVDPARLRLLLVFGDLAVVDIVSSNVTCGVATILGDFPTNVIVGAYSGVDSNTLKAASFTPFNSLGGSLLPADFSGTLVTTYTAKLPTNGVATVALKGTIQGGSDSNNTIYTGTISVGGKPFILPPG
jgi:hypothetical protein